MASHFMAMTVLKDGAVKGFIVQDVDMTLVSQDTSFNLPVREVGAEGEMDILVHRLQCLKDKGVASRGGFDAVGESNINDADEKEWGKEGVTSECRRRSGQQERAGDQFHGRFFLVRSGVG